MIESQDARLGILMYHAVIADPLDVPDWCFLEATRFRRQMEKLARTCRTIPLREAPQLLASSAEGPAIALTFDDGFQTFKDVALPILKELGLHATVYVVTDFVESGRPLWFCEVNRAIASTAALFLDWDGRRLALSTTEQKSQASAWIQQRLKKRSPAHLLEELARLCELLGVQEQSVASSPYQTLDRESIRSLCREPLVDIGAHTCSHAILSMVDPAARKREIMRSVNYVEELCGRPCMTFAYPNGRPQDYTEDCLETLRAAGIETAVTTRSSANAAAAPLLELARYGVGADCSDDEFCEWLAPFAA